MDLVEVTCTIPLTQGKVALVDESDYAWLNQYKWYIHRSKNPFYACSRQPTKSGCPILMHRLIMGLTDPAIQIDHINRNGLDNRRSNLRIATSRQNTLNRPPAKGKGVGKRGSKFYSLYSGRYLGTFVTREEAEQAYDAARKADPDAI